MSEDDPVLLPSKPRRLVVEFRSWPIATGRFFRADRR